jgi:hypothetical protein
LTSLVKKIDQHMAAAEGRTQRQLGAYFIFINNRNGLDQQLRDLAQKESLKHVGLGIETALPDYALANEAEVTVVIYNIGRRGQQHVTANFALRKGELNDATADAIVQALANVLPPVIHTVVATAKEKAQTWSYVTAKPADGWHLPDFDDLSWKQGPGGFGTQGTPGAVVRTEWKTSDIWLRRDITLPDGPFTHLFLQLHHDDDVEIYLNGVPAASLAGYSTRYIEVPISEEARKTLKAGSNILAVHCHQTGGGQYIDVGLVELKRR